MSNLDLIQTLESLQPDPPAGAADDDDNDSWLDVLFDPDQQGFHCLSNGRTNNA